VFVGLAAWRRSVFIALTRFGFTALALIRDQRLADRIHPLAWVGFLRRRGSDSPRRRGSDSPRRRGSDSPRRRGSDSPRRRVSDSWLVDFAADAVRIRLGVCRTCRLATVGFHRADAVRIHRAGAVARWRGSSWWCCCWSSSSRRVRAVWIHRAGAVRIRRVFRKSAPDRSPARRRACCERDNVR
jgi:hypothetical protein